jgi:hypothetical protein
MVVCSPIAGTEGASFQRLAWLNHNSCYFESPYPMVRVELGVRRCRLMLSMPLLHFSILVTLIEAGETKVRRGLSTLLFEEISRRDGLLKMSK